MKRISIFISAWHTHNTWRASSLAYLVKSLYCLFGDVGLIPIDVCGESSIPSLYCSNFIGCLDAIFGVLLSILDIFRKILQRITNLGLIYVIRMVSFRQIADTEKPFEVFAVNRRYNDGRPRTRWDLNGRDVVRTDQWNSSKLIRDNACLSTNNGSKSSTCQKTQA